MPITKSSPRLAALPARRAAGAARVAWVAAPVLSTHDPVTP